jgi:HK97 family phage major capsid protein
MAFSLRLVLSAFCHLLPAGFTIAIYYGDLSKAAIFGDRRQVRIKTSGERYFDTDQIGVQGTERIDINIHDVGLGSYASVAPTGVGPIVALTMG